MDAAATEADRLAAALAVVEAAARQRDWPLIWQLADKLTDAEREAVATACETVVAIMRSPLAEAA